MIILNDIMNTIKQSKKKFKLVIFPDTWNIENFVDKKVLLYPNYDVFPFESIKISKKIKALRINTLYNCLNNENNIIFTTLHAISRYTIPKDIFIQNILTFKLNQDFIINPFIYGYEKTWNVYEYGEYSQKGFVKDLFIPIYEHPIRLELFDDEITRINFFDMNSQKSIKHLNDFIFTPGSEFMLKFENNYYNNIKNFLDKNNYKNISLDIESFETLPDILYNQKQTLLDYIDIKSTDIFIINENESIKSYYNRERENLEFIFSNVKKELYKEFSGEKIENILKFKYKNIEVDKHNLLVKKNYYQKKN
jgi:transcription-repair coupling factor (superfamily II helicase)